MDISTCKPSLLLYPLPLLSPCSPNKSLVRPDDSRPTRPSNAASNAAWPAKNIARGVDAKTGEKLWEYGVDKPVWNLTPLFPGVTRCTEHGVFDGVSFIR